MQKRWVKVAVAIAALVVLLLVLIPFFINADAFRPKLPSEVSTALARPVTLGPVSFSLFSGSLVADNVSVADDPGFSSAPFLQAKALHIGIETGQFLFHHELRITRFTADSPAVQLIQAQDGKWNFSSMGSTAAKSKSSQPSALPDLTVGELKIENGSATVSSVPSTGKPFVYSDLNLAVQNFSFAKSFPFQLSASLPGSGSLKLNGTAGPVSQKDASDTPFNASIQLSHFNPVAAGLVDASKGISTNADVNAQFASDGNMVTSTGKIKAAQLQLARTGSPAPQPVDIDYTISDNLDARTGKVTDISIHTGSVAAHVTGGFRFTTQAIVLDLKLSAPNLPIEQLEQLLPAFGVRLPSGSRLRGGNLTANLSITGPATATTIAGPVEIDNTQLAGFDLGSKIQGINPIGGTSGGTAIQTVRANINSSPQTTQLTNIYGSMPQIGTAEGSGSVSPAGALDFNMVAKFNTTSGVGTLASNAMSSIGGVLGNTLHTAASSGIPLTITGTTSSPSIRANVGAIVKQQAGGLLGKPAGQQHTNPAGILRGLIPKP